MNRIHHAWSAAVGSARRNPIVCFCIFTTAACTYWEVRAARITHIQLLTTQATITRMVDTASSDLRELLRATDAKFQQAMKQRDELTRQLQLQNVEQTKSVSRLQAALRICVRDPRGQPPTASATQDDVETTSVD